MEGNITHLDENKILFHQEISLMLSFNYIYSQKDGDTSLYGVFDGHEGSRVSVFTSQRMPAELLLGQLHDVTKNCTSVSEKA